jgi:hypothetical protein
VTCPLLEARLAQSVRPFDAYRRNCPAPQLALCRREPSSRLDHARHAATLHRLHCFAAAAAAVDFRAMAQYNRSRLPFTAW